MERVPKDGGMTPQESYAKPINVTTVSTYHVQNIIFIPPHRCSRHEEIVDVFEVCQVRLEGMSDYYLQGIDSEISQGRDLNVSCNGKILTVTIRPIGPPDDQIRYVLCKHNSASFRNDDEDKPEVQEEVEG